ncbi:TonB-dependent receptor plug domain-containing protein [Sphingomonas sp. Leaf412]|uniref:TonB-dependent receptor plug domain-containing protein n=1 Tax=Sphingomonas sp. Leaf412 TaxID=1736370 RepID=UPI001F3945A7|nr:TonB-dependent receptor [Sphingomonas sp. Leaf412]
MNTTGRCGWLAGAGMLALACPAAAQQAPAGGEPVPAAAAAEDAAATEESGADIVVTGSRIRRPDYEAPNPIVSADARDIQQSGNTNLTTFLLRVPALVGSRDSTRAAGGDAVSSQQFGQAGLNQLNLRNLGINRTLTLVDGRRHVAAEASNAAVDINSIPTDLIQRVDVLTGAVGAVYGADGVTGVANFILRRDFDGLSARAQMGVSQYGDGATRFASIVAGRNFADGRANVTLAYEYSGEDRIPYEARKYLRQGNRRYLIPNDADQPDDPNVPDNVLLGNLKYTYISPLGAIFVGGESNPSFDGLGRPYDPGRPVAYYYQGGVSTDVPGFYQGDLTPGIQRHTANVLSSFEVSDAFKLSVDAKYARTDARTFGQFPETYYLPIALDNPFIPGSIRAAAVEQGAENLFLNRHNIDFGRLGESDRRETYRGVVAASGRLSDHATYDAYYQYGRTDLAITRLGSRLASRYLEALDAVAGPGGTIVCRSTLAAAGNGCIPINPFGPGPTDAAALAYFQRNDRSFARIDQHVANASVSGDFGQFFTLPGGPVQFSFGGEYRRESSRFDPNANLVAGNYFPGDEPGTVLPSRGSFDVWEAFGEVNVPILRDRPFFHLLSVGAAGRYSDYSTVGSTRTWQFTGIWAPVRDISFRGSYGQAVRAPNIGELFQPTSSTSAFFDDPCTTRSVGNGTSFRAANCRAQLSAAGRDTLLGESDTGFVISGISQGNRALRPERARTWTAGVVLRPGFLPGLSASADWYDIDLNDAINTVGGNDLVNLCVDSPTLDNPYCAAFTRTQGNGRISGFTVGPQNVANFRTSGLDVTIDYRLDAGDAGTFDLRLIGGYLDRLTFVAIPGAPVNNNLDSFGAPRWNANFAPTWTRDRVSVNYNLRWFNATRAFDRNTTAANPDVAAARYLRFDPLWQHDMQIAYQVPDGFGFYGGVTNFTDQKPDPAAYGTNVPISPLGRFFYVGARLRY